MSITIETIQEGDFISLTDIARQNEKTEPNYIIASWLKNRNTLSYLETWEKLYNPNFKPEQMLGFKEKYLENRNALTPKRWIEEMGAIGIVSKQGRYGGTYAHKDIAFNFCYWLSPPFQLYVAREFQRLKEEEFQNRSLKWHLSKITDNIEEVRNLLDTIPGQDPFRNRLKAAKKNKD